MEYDFLVSMLVDMTCACWSLSETNAQSLVVGLLYSNRMAGIPCLRQQYWIGVPKHVAACQSNVESLKQPVLSLTIICVTTLW